MESTNKSKLLRVYISNTDIIDHRNLYEYLAQAAKKQGMSGVTVYRGIMGYGASNILHSDRLWEITEKTPVIVEFIDEVSKIEKFKEFLLPLMNKIPKGCLITEEEVSIILSKKGK